MRGPPITITCECGEMRHVAYGEAWQCETCGRRWNTTQIPEADYRGIVGAARRARLVLILVAAGLAAAFGLLAVVVSERLFLLFPLVLAVWLIWYMPLWRRRQRRLARELPTWELRPE